MHLKSEKGRKHSSKYILSDNLCDYVQSLPDVICSLFMLYVYLFLRASHFSYRMNYYTTLLYTRHLNYLWS